MSRVLYEVDGPAYAVLLGGSWSTGAEPGYDVWKQIRDFSVELFMNAPSNVWIPDGSERLVTLPLARQLEEKHPVGMYLQPTTVNWYEGMKVPEDWPPPPALMQIRTTEVIHAAPQCIRYGKDGLSEGFDSPLSVVCPGVMPEEGVWEVDESGGILLFTKGLRDIIAAVDPEVTFIEVPCIDPAETNAAGSSQTNT